MIRSQLHINQVSYLNPILESFRHFGVNLERVKNKSDMKYFDINNINAYVPAKSFEEFLHNIYMDQGIRQLDSQLIGQLGLYDMGEYGKYLMKLPDVLSIINESIKLESIINSNVQSKLLIKGVETFYHWKYINKFTNGRKASEEFCFFLVLNALKFAVGPVFQITSICIPGYHHEVLKENLPAGSYKLILTENHYAIGFPTQMLNVSQANHRSELERPILPNGSYRSKITHLFGGMEEGVMPSLELLAMQSDISTRGLSRHLANEGTNFRELLNIYLLNKALFYLEHTNHSIEVISELLGYHHVSNFIRAFKNATTVSPLIFRSQLSSSGGK